ncbi:MAG TPA: 2-amino-4-hydroxy-6-hydroxymethyldihydropteridine diphosphokinase [Candidatus Saccharimonadales bacterium]
MTGIYLALGSNVGDSKTNIARTITLLGTGVKQIEQAPLYASKAVGYTDQPDFLNTAVSGQTDLEPAALLDFLKDIERQIGRSPGFKWGPREIDIDIIFYGDKVMHTGKLIIPHPHFRERDFVLQPLYDINPSLVDPVTGQTIQKLLAKMAAGQKSLIRQVDEKL